MNANSTDLMISSPQDVLSMGYAEKDVPLILSHSTTDKALAATDSIIAALGHFSSIAPIPGLNGVFKSISAILSKIKAVRSNTDELQDLIRQIFFLLVNVNGQALALEVDPNDAATTKFKDVVQQFSGHLQAIGCLCDNLIKTQGLYATFHAQTISEDIAKIRREIDLAFRIFSITSTTCLNDFLAAWKKENKEDVERILLAIMENSSKDDSKDGKGASEAATGTLDFTDHSGRNRGDIKEVIGDFNSNNEYKEQPDFLNDLVNKGNKVTYTDNSGSNSGKIGVIHGSFNSNNRHRTVVTPTRVDAYTFSPSVGNNSNNRTKNSNNVNTIHAGNNNVIGNASKRRWVWFSRA